MAIIRESVTNSGSGGSTTTHTLNMPATRPDGDLFIATLSKDGSADWSGVPSGWTRIDGGGSGTGVKTGMWARVGSSEPASHAWTSPSSEAYRGSIIRYSGDFGDIADIGFAETQGSSGAVATCPTVAGKGTDAAVLRVAGWDSGISMTSAWAQSGNTELSYNRTGGTTPVGFGVTSSISEDDTPTDATGTVTHTADTSDNWHSMTAAIPVASGGFTGTVAAVAAAAVAAVAGFVGSFGTVSATAAAAIVAIVGAVGTIGTVAAAAAPATISAQGTAGSSPTGTVTAVAAPSSASITGTSGDPTVGPADAVAPAARQLIAIEAQAFDVTVARTVLSGPPPAGVRPAGDDLSFEVLGEVATLRASDRGFVTHTAALAVTRTVASGPPPAGARPAGDDLSFTVTEVDDPTDTPFAARVDVLRVSARLYSGAEPGGQAPALSGSLRLLNGDGKYEDWQARGFEGRALKIWQGVDGQTFRTFGLLLNARTEGVGWDEDGLSLTLTDQMGVLDQRLQTNVYGGGGNADGGADVEGQEKPFCFGPTKNKTAKLIDAVNGIYQINDGQMEAVDAVRIAGVAVAFDSDTTDLWTGTTTAGQFRSDISKGLIQLGSQPDGVVTVDLKGDKSDGVYVVTTADIVQRILETRLSASQLADLGGLDPDLFSAVNTTQGATIAWSARPGMTIRDALSALLSPILGYPQIGRTGRFGIGVLAAPANSKGTITAADIVSIRRLTAPVPPWRRRMGYRRMQTVQDRGTLAASVSDADAALYSNEFRRVPAEAQSVKTKRPSAPDVEVPSLFDLEADALAEGNRQNTLMADRDGYVIRIQGRKFAFWRGDALTVAIDKFGLDAGKDFLVVAVNDDLLSPETDLEVWG